MSFFLLYFWVINLAQHQIMTKECDLKFTDENDIQSEGNHLQIKTHAVICNKRKGGYVRGVMDIIQKYLLLPSHK